MDQEVADGSICQRCKVYFPDVIRGSDPPGQPRTCHYCDDSVPNPEPVDPVMQCHLSTIMPFGKHKARTIGWIVDHDLLYLDWLRGRDIRSGRLADALDAVCEDRSVEIKRMLEDC